MAEQGGVLGFIMVRLRCEGTVFGGFTSGIVGEWIKWVIWVGGGVLMGLWKVRNIRGPRSAAPHDRRGGGLGGMGRVYNKTCVLLST